MNDVKEVLSKRAKKYCRQGKVLFYVHAFPESKKGGITVVKPAGKPRYKKWAVSSGGAWFCDTKKEVDGFKYSSSFSLQDCNLIPNSYNSHQIFDSEKAANKYLETVTQ